MSNFVDFSDYMKFIIKSSGLRIFKFNLAWSDFKFCYGKIELTVKSRCTKFSLPKTAG